MLKHINFMVIYRATHTETRYLLSTFLSGTKLTSHEFSQPDNKIYRPISLLPVCGKIFENLIFDCIYEHLTDNQLIAPNQPGFRPGDSTISQLLYITHSIHTAFEEYPSRETKAVFLDISKAFDIFVLIDSYLPNHKQRVVLNGKSSNWSSISAGLPQGSVLGPFFFLV